MIEGISCQTRSPMRSIVCLCEQSGYRSFGEKFTNQNAFYAPKLSYKIFSGGTPSESRSFSTAPTIIGGPHIR